MADYQKPPPTPPAIVQKVDTNLAHNKLPAILVVDFFKPAREHAKSGDYEKLDVDGDGKGDLRHGELVSRVIQAEGLQTIDYDPSRQKVVNRPKGELQKVLITNHSYGFDATFKDLSTITGMEITPKNVASKRAALLDRLEEISRGKNPDDVIPGTKQLTYRMVQGGVGHARSCEKSFREQGTISVFAAGNDGPTLINMTALGEGSVMVGGLGKNGKPHPDSANHSLVKRWTAFELTLEPVKEGLDLNRDGKADIRWSETTSKGKNFGVPSEIRVVSTEVVKKVTEQIEELSLERLARFYKDVKLPTGIYENIFVPSPGTFKQDGLVAYRGGLWPRVTLIREEDASKIPKEKISKLGDNVSEKLWKAITDDIKRDFGTELYGVQKKDLEKIISKVGLPDGIYDLSRLIEQVEQREDVRYLHLLQLPGAGDPFIIENGRCHIPDNFNPTIKIPGTSFGTPKIAAEIAKEQAKLKK